jgi:IS30 family transposase
VTADVSAGPGARRPWRRRVEACTRLLEAVNDGFDARWSPQQIAARLKVEHPDDRNMRVSHESRYQALYCQARGQLGVEPTGALRRKGTRRVGVAERRRITNKRKVITEYARFTLATGIPVFFCDPHSPWQRGSNENTVACCESTCQGADLSFYSQDHFDAVAFELNNLPRQTLDRLKPCERLDQLLSDANDALTG